MKIRVYKSKFKANGKDYVKLTYKSNETKSTLSNDFIESRSELTFVCLPNIGDSEKETIKKRWSHKKIDFITATKMRPSIAARKARY